MRTLLGAALMLRTGTTTAVHSIYGVPTITFDTLAPMIQAYSDAG